MKRALALAATLALAGCGAPEPEAAPPSPALWEVRDADGPRGWLFGTIHALPDGTEWDTPALDAAMSGAGVLVVEIAALGDARAIPFLRKARIRTSSAPRWKGINVNNCLKADAEAAIAFLQREGR